VAAYVIPGQVCVCVCVCVVRSKQMLIICCEFFSMSHTEAHVYLISAIVLILLTLHCWSHSVCKSKFAHTFRYDQVLCNVIGCAIN